MHELYEAREKYLGHALSLSDEEVGLIADFAGWLPGDVIDAHAHSNLPVHVSYIHPRAYGHMLSTFPSFSIEESQQVNGLFHPGVNIRSLRFPKTFKGINHREANDYLLASSPSEDRVAIFGLPEDPDYTIGMMDNPRVSALKMYYSYLDPPAEEIYQIFTPQIMTAAEEKAVPVVLHPPKVITTSLEEVLQLKQDFPNLAVCIAHLGLSKFDVPGLQEAYERLASETDVVLDTALNPSDVVCRRALDTLGPERVLYGSDAPLSLIRSVPFKHPEKGQRITTELRYHWQDVAEHAEYSHLAQGAVHSHWLTLGAVRKAIQAFGDEIATKQAVFHDNAARFYRF